MINKKRNICINISLVIVCITCCWLAIDLIFNNKREPDILKVIILYAVFAYYVSVVIHELAHCFTFIFFKIQIRAICFTPFCFINNGEKWETKINWNNIGLGGATVSNQVVIKNDNDFIKIKKAFAYSMLVATSISIAILLAGAVFMIIGYILYKNENLVTLGSFFLIINSVIVMGCFTKSNNASGDFFAYLYLLKDDDIVTQLMYGYIRLSVNYDEIRENNGYLRGRLIDCFERKIKENIIDLDAMVITSSLITEFLICNIDLPNSVLKYINEFYEKSAQFEKVKNTEAFKKFVVMIAYYFESIGKHEEALKIYRIYIINFSNSNIDKYRKIQSEQIICHKDNTDFLLKDKNIKPDSFYSFYRIFDGYIFDEIILNEGKTVSWR